MLNIPGRVIGRLSVSLSSSSTPNIIKSKTIKPMGSQEVNASYELMPRQWYEQTTSIKSPTIGT